jgi:hypothetical protein
MASTALPVSVGVRALADVYPGDGVYLKHPRENGLSFKTAEQILSVSGRRVAWFSCGKLDVGF